MNGELLEAFREAHHTRRVDWVLAYVRVCTSWLIRFRHIESSGVPTVNLSLDDKNSWDCGERRWTERWLARVGRSLRPVVDVCERVDVVGRGGRRACDLPPRGCNVEDASERSIRWTWV